MRERERARAQVCESVSVRERERARARRMLHASGKKEGAERVRLVCGLECRRLESRRAYVMSSKKNCMSIAPTTSKRPEKVANAAAFLRDLVAA